MRGWVLCTELAGMSLENHDFVSILEVVRGTGNSPSFWLIYFSISRYQDI